MVNSIQNNYLINTNKQSSDEKKTKYTAEEESKISAEENAILYEKYKKAGYSKEEFDYVLKNGTTFPPFSAPGSVRRAWRQAKENASPEERAEMKAFTIMFDGFRRDYPNYMSTMNNDTNGYLKMVKDMKSYAEQYNVNGDSQLQLQYKWYTKTLQIFDTELKKFA
ncbi:hypothetical protein [Clostridium cellulovorans]|uniref:Uncharacterized protein n=1 Tax=Clostridium cellulovorans (strain ATCC 35296 / DSM 3052 / OCM 3 / 743B) TaxID=573061 RepID=D9SP85_CLOC7|nr:hypothetical protein [Clostridium cellulovorans]ADL52050.1 hypothetical protein Clocel_2331 [Clostridium cellulovorans 743B]